MNAPDPIAAARLFTEAYFHDIAGAIDRLLAPGEFYTATLCAEISEFVRFNRGKVRQPGAVSQAYLDVDLVVGKRHATQRLTLTGDMQRDANAIGASLRALRDVVHVLAEDPHLLYSTEVHSTRSVRGTTVPAAEAIVDELLALSKGHDLVGLHAGGPVMRGFANSLGQRNWHEVTSFQLQWSLYHRTDKAVKSALSGLAWDSDALRARMQHCEEHLGFISRPARSLRPGDYRVFLTPAAMEEIVGMLQWGGFSARALATHQSSLTRMREAGVRLDSRVTLREATADGLSPAFQSAGFIRPDVVPLIERGVLAESLISPRTAREFGLASNGANPEETAESLVMQGGDLAQDDVMHALDTGLYVGNLWYLNYSDRPACRITGMTRFATFWVEHGRIVAPVDVLRFDDTIFRMLGANLESLTRDTELRLDSSTYMQRSVSSMRLPGALLTSMKFTL